MIAAARGIVVAALLALACAFALVPARVGRAAGIATEATAPPAAAVAATETVCAGAGAAAARQALNHAGLVVAFGDSRVESFCIEFAEEEITGVELLERSRLETVLMGTGGGLGSGVCRIEDTGCSDPGDCFCQCRGAGCEYWSYWGARDGEWRFQTLGPSNHRLRDGDVDAWLWGSGRTPPESSASGVCPVELPPPAPAQATRTPTPNGTAGGGGPPLAGDAAAQPPGERSTPVSGEARTSLPVDETPRPTEQPPGVLGRADPAAGAGAAGAEIDGGGGAPAGLIAFGAVAGAIVAVTGGVALRKRLRG